jgi:hypothetical protein
MRTAAAQAPRWHALRALRGCNALRDARWRCEVPAVRCALRPAAARAPHADPPWCAPLARVTPAG